MPQARRTHHAGGHPHRGHDDGQPAADASGPAAGFWSGTISFGLVSVPVSLFPATRSGGVHLRMLAGDGTPLARRYVCPKEDKPVDGDDIVRGYPVQKDEWVIVADRELEAIAPEKSRDIDLREFVPAGAIDPMYFERGYYLVPGEEGAHKAYRLLAEVMEKEQRAGIATFVMRGKEYLVAIFAERGILRAETMRFQDELRSAGDVGLPDGPVAKPQARVVSKIEKAIDGMSEDALEPDELEDREAEKVMRLVVEKRKRGEDVVEAADAESDDEESPSDLVRALAESLKSGRRGPRTAGGEKKATRRPAARAGGKRSRRKAS